MDSQTNNTRPRGVRRQPHTSVLLIGLLTNVTVILIVTSVDENAFVNTRHDNYLLISLKLPRNRCINTVNRWHALSKKTTQHVGGSDEESDF